MTILRPLIVMTLLLTAMVSCEMYEPPVTEEKFFDAELFELRDWMSGSFSSAAQAKASGSKYLDIRLETIPIWTGRKDGLWLYVEQAAANALDRPYRQRVYHLTRNDADQIVSRVFALPNNGKSHIGAFKSENPLANLSPSKLTLRKGCHIVLERVGPRTFLGSTSGDNCKSSLRGASYATSQVTVTPVELRSWDQGFDNGNRQVWGATDGAYVFSKKGL